MAGPAAPRTITVAPYYRLVPPGTPPSPGPEALVLAPGHGFGDGSHETTQLCLLALGYLLRQAPRPRVLDFGAGNGVLSLAAARAGSIVEAVELDPGALAEARHNLELNGLTAQVTTRTMLSEAPAPFDLVVANILVDVLVASAEALCVRLAPTGALVLSGLTATCVPQILAAYRERLPGHTPTVYSRGEWRAVVFVPSRPA
jgi:ribosomal protein L11 methyltransferase